MKILIAPAHYQLDPSVGSEYTRAFEYISELVKDPAVTGDILVGYAPFTRLGNLTVHSMWQSMPKVLTLAVKLKFLIWVSRQSRRLCKTTHYDTVWHLGPFSIGETFSPFALALPRRTKFVIGPIYTPFAPRTLKSRLSRFITKIFLPLSWLTLKRADVVATIEDSGRAKLSKLGIDSQVLPLTIASTDFIHKGPRSLGSKIQLLSVGHLVERKRMLDIVDALALLGRDHGLSSYHLTIVGDGPQKSLLKARIKQLKLSSHVTLVGAVPRGEVHKYFAQSDLFISASLDESMPGVYFEAMTSGLPMVLTKNSTSLDLEATGFGGKICEKYNPKSIADNIVALTSDQKIYANASQKNISLMQGKFNFVKNMAKLKTFLSVNHSTVKETPGKSKLITFLIVVSFIIAVLAIVMAVRGKYGNPTPDMLSSKSWKESGPFELSPERGRFVLTSALVEERSVNFPPDMARFTTPDVGYSNGKYVSLFAPLLSFLVVPGYIIGKYFSIVQVGTFMNVGVFALLNWVLIYHLSRFFTSSRLARAIASTAFLFATPSYAYGVNLYQHHATVLFLLTSISLIFARSSVIKHFFALFLCALSISLDYPNAFLFLPVGLYVLSSMFNLTKDKVSTSVSFSLLRSLALLGVIVPTLFFLWFNNLSYGSPLTMLGSSKIQSVNDVDSSGAPVFVKVSGRTVESIESELNARESKSQSSYFNARALINGLTTQLFSRDRGILYFAPVLLFGLLGAFTAYRKNQALTLLLIAVATANLLLYSMWGDPWGGWAFGSRYLIPAYAILSIFIASFLSHFRRNLLVLMVFLGLLSYSLYVNSAGALSTSANPPQVQVLALEALTGREEKYSFDRNLEFLKHNPSKSFVYQTWVTKYLSSWQYFSIIAYTLISLSAILCIALFFERQDQS